jgi:hypothetical protein
MDNTLRQYYEDRFEMFTSKGWKNLVEDVKRMEEVTSNISNCADEKSFWIAKGELRIIKWFLSLEELSQEAYNGLKEE